ncbi:MAG: hypothetical protein COA52_10730 [Hyphomicrobiales bacterium]|nr:MAG: hypothetical protein COA52_10730 [Hyphomicrobiales bacterium]
MKNTYTLDYGMLKFISKHAGLNQLSYDIAQGMESLTLPHKVIVFCGIHKKQGINWFRSGFKLGIQTEQFLDPNGIEVAPGSKRDNYKKNIIYALEKLHVILDINASNYKFYQSLEIWPKIKNKIVFGPRIFPNFEVKYKEPINDKYIFFGSISNSRRGPVIEELRKKYPVDIESNLFGKQLHDCSSKYKAIINVHYFEAIYSEAPRILTSYLSGKPTISETLCPIFECGKHYIHINDDSFSNLERSKLKNTHQELGKYVTQKYSFEGFLRSVI